MSTSKLPPVRLKSLSPPALFGSGNIEVFQNNVELFPDGRQYMLNDVPHQLPAPNKLRPFMDRKAGDVETWPASKDPKHNLTKLSAKPKLLLKLENYLQKELHALGCHIDDDPNEKRIQPYREVFEYVIENFRTYKPLLSSIKQEYEGMLSKQNDTIKSLEPLKAMLVNMNEQCEQKILHIKQDEKQELLEMREENFKLEGTITSLKEEISSLQRQVKKCQKEIGVEYKKYRDELDSRKLLIQDINDLRYQQEELKKALSGHPTDGDDDEGATKEDAVILKIALTKAREELANKTQRLTEVLSDYGDVVPRRDFESVERQLKCMQDEHTELRKNNNQLLKEHSALIDVHKKVIEQRDEFALDCERMRQSATPRPDWNKCGLYVEGGFDRWNKLSEETSTNEKLDLLLSEMTGQDVSIIKAGGGIVDYFEPKGTDPSLPKYLHSSERVRNRRLNKRDLLIMIKDVWTEKMESEGAHPFTKDRTNMADHLYSYLRKRFGVDAMVTEWGYNINDAMTRYNFDSIVQQFQSILNGELDEDVYYMKLQRLENVFTLFLHKDAKEAGAISKTEFTESLTSNFHFLNGDDVIKMVDDAVAETGGEPEDENIPYKDLFTEDDEGKKGQFVNSIFDSYQKSKEKIIQELELVFEKKSEVTSTELSSALLNIDPKLSESSNQDTLKHFVAMAFRNGGSTPAPTTNPDGVNSCEKSKMLQNLRTSCIAHCS